jgi:hypothetical protein
MSKLQSNDFLNISCIVEDNKFSILHQHIKNKLVKLGGHVNAHPVVYKGGYNVFNLGSNTYLSYQIYKMLHRLDNETGEDNLANNDHES